VTATTHPPIPANGGCDRLGSTDPVVLSLRGDGCRRHGRRLAAGRRHGGRPPVALAAPSSPPTVASYAPLTRASGWRVEVLGERSETTQLFANVSRAFTLE
jgi:hypothetical protein